MAQLPELAPFSLEERDRRHAAVRAAMQEAGVDVLVALPQWMPGDALYLANRPGAVVFPRDEGPTLVIPKGVRSPPSGWIGDVRNSAHGATARVPWGLAVAPRLRELCRPDSRVALCGLRGGDLGLTRQPEGSVTHAAVEEILRVVDRDRLVDGNPLLSAVRYVKSAEEIAVLRRSTHIAELALRASVESARAGSAASEVYGRLLFEQCRGGADAPHAVVLTRSWGQPRVFNMNVPRTTLENGSMLEIELEPSVRGYTSQVSQDLFVGSPPEVALALLEQGRGAFHRACAAMRPGATFGEVEQSVAALTEGTPFAIDFVLHGRGLGHDGPLLIPSTDHEQAAAERIREGNVFILKPSPRMRTDANCFLSWGDTVVVTATGAERLGQRSHDLLQVS